MDDLLFESGWAGATPAVPDRLADPALRSALKQAPPAGRVLNPVDRARSERLQAEGLDRPAGEAVSWSE